LNKNSAPLNKNSAPLNKNSAPLNKNVHGQPSDGMPAGVGVRALAARFV